MNCPTCGTEVMEQAGFCHRCGAVLSAAGAHAPTGDPASDAQGSGGAALAAADPSDGTASTPSASPAERFVESISTRRGGEDEREEEVWRGGYASKAMIGAWALSGVVSLVLLLIGIAWVRNGTLWTVLIVLVLLLWIYQVFVLKYRQWSVRYRLTNQRLIHERGILKRVTDRIETIDIDDITFEQTVLERLVGVGTIRIASSDRTDPELLLRGIDNVKEVAGTIDDIRRSERRRRGVHIESI